jgi:SPP1 family predicted phage head-tail adaptor
MRAGLFKTRVIIEQQSTDQDDIGQPLDVWTTFSIVWADIRLAKGLESIKAGAVTSIVQASVRIRYITGVTAGMRLIQGSTKYNIVSVQPDVANRKYVDLVCEIVS